MPQDIAEDRTIGMDLRAFMRSRQFNIVFSFILGLFLVILFKPSCRSVGKTVPGSPFGERRGGACYDYRPPPVADVCSGAYKLDDKCYKFKTRDVPCPPSGVIEPYLDEGQRNA